MSTSDSIHVSGVAARFGLTNWRQYIIYIGFA